MKVKANGAVQCLDKLPKNFLKHLFFKTMYVYRNSKIKHHCNDTLATSPKDLIFGVR